MSPTSSLPDRSTLNRWLASLGWQGCEETALAGDVGHRRYYRLHRAAAEGPSGLSDATDARAGTGGHESLETAVLAVYPAALRDACRRFVATSGLLTGAGVRVPRILAADCDLGAMLVEFLGDATLGEWAEGRDWDAITPRFEAALEAAARIAHLNPKAVAPLSPPLDAELLRRELHLTTRHFLEPQGLVEGDAGHRVRSMLDDLAEAIARVPPRPCHRDFMVRNLTPWENGVAVLDHQDLRLGPPLYDLASLLNDTLFPSPDLERRLVEAWCQRDDEPEYHRVSAQRTLKAVGSYAMATADGKTFHRHRIAPTFGRALEHLARVPEAKATAEALAERWRECGAGAMLDP